jgi:hypothetical protein
MQNSPEWQENMSTTDGMMVGVHSNHQEGDIDNSINIKATCTMQHGLLPVKKLKPLHQHKQSSRNIQPNYNNTQLNKHKSYTRQHQLNQSIHRYNEKLQQRRAQLQGNTSTHQISEWVGDTMDFCDSWISGDYIKTFCVCSININGISQDLDWIEWDMMLHSMHALQIDALGVTEPNINFKNHIL